MDRELPAKGFSFCPAESRHWFCLLLTLSDGGTYEFQAAFLCIHVFEYVTLRHSTLKATEGAKADDLLKIALSQWGFTF